MTDLATGLGVQPRGVTAPGRGIASAADLAGPSVRLHHLLAAIQARFTRAEKTHRPKHYPHRFYFIEDAAMSREMHRL